jgi:hypothetical protein
LISMFLGTALESTSDAHSRSRRDHRSARA